MREIKFRGQRVDTKEWVYGYYFKSPLTDENSGADPKDGWFFLIGKERHCISNENGAVFEVIPESVGQLVELRDLNNKEPVYEGDVWKLVHKYCSDKYEEKIVVIKYNSYWACFDFGNLDGTKCYHEEDWHLESMTKLGTIHETTDEQLKAWNIERKS